MKWTDSDVYHSLFPCCQWLQLQFHLFNQPSSLEETQVKMTQFSDNLQFLWAENSPASKACHFISQRVSETPSTANRTWFCVCMGHVFEWVCRRRYATKKEKRKKCSAAVRRKKSNGYFSLCSVLIEEPWYFIIYLCPCMHVCTLFSVFMCFCPCVVCM